MLNYAGDSGKAGDVQQRLMIDSRLIDSGDLEARERCYYVIARGCWRTMQARLARWAMTVDNV